jgi:hypothetical protein
MRRLMTAALAAIIAAATIFRPEDIPPAYAPWAPLDPVAAPNLVTSIKLMRAGRNPAYCLAALARGAARAVPIADRETSANCHVRAAVRLEALSASRLDPEPMRCEIALRLYMWERHALQAAALETVGAAVASIDHYGSYSCRPIRSHRGLTSRMSEHATANAFDISGFVVADGRRITLRAGWNAGGAEARVLRAARDGLCDYFRVVLGPDYNALHADHFHVDQGLFLRCR